MLIAKYIQMNVLIENMTHKKHFSHHFSMYMQSSATLMLTSSVREYIEEIEDRSDDKRYMLDNLYNDF